MSTQTHPSSRDPYIFPLEISIVGEPEQVLEQQRYSQDIIHTTACNHSLSCSYKHLHSNTGQLESVYSCIIIASRLLCGCVPFLFPAQAPCVAVFPSYSLLKLLVWLCSLPTPCSSSLCGCVPCSISLHVWLCSPACNVQYMHVVCV